MTTATLFGVLVAFLLLAAPARAAIALVDNELTTASTFANNSTALRLTTNLTVTASANTLVVVATFRNTISLTEAPSALNWTNATTTNTLTLAVQIASKATTGRCSAIYYCYNPMSGSGYNISGKLSGQAGSSGALVAYTLSGVDTTIPTPPSGSASATGAGASSLLLIVSGITGNSWAAVGGDVAAASGISITATNSGAATGTPVLATTTGGFSSTTSASMGYISAIAGGSDTFTMTNAVQDCSLSAAVFSPSSSTFLAISQQPQTVTIPSGQGLNATFTVSAVGNPAVSSYQWYQISGGATNLIAGANTSSYTTNSPTVSAGYFVVVGNGSTSITSSVANLNIFTSGIVTATVSGGVVSLSWPSDNIGWWLQVQTNSLAIGLSTNWVDLADVTMTNQMVLPLNTGNGCVFYRLLRPPIDRYALVTRHNIQWNSSTGTIPLGNGEFCFNADGTGLQTFGGNSMSHWAWHSFPLPSGVTADQIPATGTFETGRVQGQDNPPSGTAAIETWMKQNPHIMNLGRLQLCNANGTALITGQISGLARTLDLWSGVQTSSYQVNGQTVSVETCVHPALDAVVVRIQSPLVASGALQVSLDFSYPQLHNASWVGSFSQTNGNTTTMTVNGGSRADFARVLDTTNYDVSLVWSPGGKILAAGNTSPNRFLLSAPGTNSLEFICAFSSAPVSVTLPTVEQSLVDTSNHWVNFWSTGGAIDLSASADSRWFELERRIVLSQYELAAQDAGSWPESENGLMGIDPWVGQFHMEMLWWHLAHYALWNRWAMLTNALPYQRFIPQAQALAAQLDYAGLKWGKEVGPEGRTAPWIYSQVLLWRQPHPIFFAELDYRLHPTLATLKNWTNIVFGTADNMADYPDLNTNTGSSSLAFDVPSSEKAMWSDTVFDLAYWRWGLNQAQVWRQRLGLARNPLWDQVRTNLAPMPVLNGLFVDYAGDTTTYTTTANGHPDPIGVYGMLPPIEGVDTNIAHSTVLKLWSTWNWNSSSDWGWDFPWMAMAAARTGEPQIAVNALLDNPSPNQYDTRGVNNGWYLPGNGGLLYAVAMMAAGWDGSSGSAPGFPNDGSWTVKWEGLNKAP